MDWTTILCALISSGVVLAGYIMVDRREKNKQFIQFKDEIIQKLNEHRTEYLDGIEEVKDQVTDIRAVYQQNTAIIELKIDALEKKQDQHNSLISRMYAVESFQKLQEQENKVMNHRLDSLEKR